MYSVKVRNQDAILAALKRIEKCKGKAIPACQLQDGDLFRDDGRCLDIFKRDGEHYSVFPAWHDLLGQMSIGTGGNIASLGHKPVTVVAHKPDYPEPDKESAVKTIVHPRADGTVCCQNLVYGLSGQHFHITQDKLVELKDHHDREWIVTGDPCDCDLAVGEVREYDGHRHTLGGE